jgi:hypothetical protein
MMFLFLPIVIIGGGGKAMKSRTARRALALAVAVGLGAALAAAQSKPDLNGTWKMNPSKSKFGPQGGPGNITVKFDQKESSLTEALTIGDSGGDQTIELKYTTDGKEAAQEIAGTSVKTTARWEGEVLVIEWRGEGRAFHRKITLSADGKTMTMAVHQVRPDGEVDETVVLEKQ